MLGLRTVANCTEIKATPSSKSRLQASEAEAQRDLARAAVVVAEQATAGVQAEFEAAQRARAALQGELDAERQAHAAARARQEAGQRQIEVLERQLGELRTQFSTELEHTREQVAVAQERASATERRALREIDQERTLRQTGEQVVTDLRTELAAVQARAQDAAVAGAEERARLQAERDTLSRQLAEAEQALGRGEAGARRAAGRTGSGAAAGRARASRDHRGAPHGDPRRQGPATKKPSSSSSRGRPRRGGG
jgi:chromosome segregation ATPase